METLSKDKNVHAYATTAKWRYYVDYLMSNITTSKVFQAVAVTAAGYISFKYLAGLVYRKYKKYPRGPMGYPMIGYPSATQESYLMNVSGLYGALSYCKYFHQDMITINSSQTAKHSILNKKEFLDHFNTMNEKEQNLFFQTLSLGDIKDASFLHVNGQNWKVRRQYALVALIRFCDSKFMSKLLYNTMNNVVFRQLNKICDKNKGGDGSGNGTLWCPHDILYYISFNTIYHTNFGESLDINDKKLIEMRQNIADASVCLKELRAALLSNTMYKMHQIFTPEKTERFERVLDKRKEIYIKMIEERRKFLKENKEVIEQISQNKYEKYRLCYIDYLIYLLDYCNDDNNNNNNGSLNSETTKLNERRVVNDLVLMFFAGTDTTASSLTYGIFLLAKSPKIQKLLFEKLSQLNQDSGNNNINGDNNNDNNNEVNMLELSKLMECAEYRAFIYEVLRISTPVPFGLFHVPKHDTKVKTHENETFVIPQKGIITTNIIYIHTGDTDKTKEKWKNKEYGLNMTDVCLENWLKKDKTDNNKNKFLMNESFIAFGSGIRDCVGQQLAIKEIHLVLAYLILNYEFEAPNGDTSFKIKRIHGVTAGIDEKQKVIIKKR